MTQDNESDNEVVRAARLYNQRNQKKSKTGRTASKRNQQDSTMNSDQGTNAEGVDAGGKSGSWMSWKKATRVGIGSAAVIAALLYASRHRK